MFISFSLVFLSHFPTFHLICSFLWRGDAMPTGHMNTLRLSKVCDLARVTHSLGGLELEPAPNLGLCDQESRWPPRDLDHVGPGKFMDPTSHPTHGLYGTLGQISWPLRGS